MRPKNLVTLGLALFVVATAVTLVLKEMGAGHPPAPASAVKAPSAGPKLIAYYLHGKVRCVTCNDIEKTAKETVESGFAKEMDSGRIEWRTANYDEPGNEHFAREFKLAAPCVVLASLRDGKQEGWKSLPEVWELIGDKPAFRDFIVRSVREELGETPRTEHAATPALQAADVAWPSPSKETRALPRLLDLGSTRCIPCKEMAPVLEDLKSRYRGTLQVDFIDVFENSDALARYDVSTIPTQIFFDATGKELFRHEGAFSKEEILRKWRELGMEL